ncbi:flagellar protein FlgN [Gracilibacillus alcaliphilus]|uniref:flagellar protein FlgN n=1 Tax=Gracilibacillus alcaliphilus TaxID=1401441 RepID=UPI00195C4EA5|nr:flagellar protein FlgN [Gracilibacillus alcaliphilus]MBM7676033.1 flagellar biosynthesis/type III secretory pathway chaperone [Gracilibacillus alcaliphilus]
MAIEKIIKQLNALIELHHSLLEISTNKTEIIKSGKIEELQQLLVKEQKHVQAITQMEERRIEAVRAWAEARQLDPEQITVTTIIEEYASGVEKKQLETVTVALAGLLMELRQQEDLNQQLTQQSLQFVQLSLNMLQPSINQLNYGNTAQSKNANTPKQRSVFDSKA